MLTLWVHTPKAIRIGCPADRLYVAVRRLSDGDLLAWKCTLTPRGIEHPAYWKLGTRSYDVLPYTEASLRKLEVDGRQPNGSEPTAFLKLDSFYKEVTIHSLAKRFA